MSWCFKLSIEFTVFNQVMSLFLKSDSGSVFAFSWGTIVPEFKPGICLQVLLLLSSFLVVLCAFITPGSTLDTDRNCGYSLLMPHSAPKLPLHV